jgi:putative iron-dependent peroxidase
MTLDGAPQPAGGPAPQAVTQPVAAPLTAAAIFLVVTVRPGQASETAVRGLSGDLGGLLRAVGFRDLGAALTCVMGFGAELWDRLAGPERPAGLHPFREILAGDRHAVATPGDLLFHIRADRMDLCFELATHITSRLAGALDAVDEVHGFRYFDDRDLIGFVDGTENPTGQDAVAATVIGAEDPGYAGGSYVIVQKYLHDMAKWNALPTEEQENIIGRTKLDDIELDDAVKPTYAHNALTTIVENGEEIDIVRDNMPFGNTAMGEHGTYFIGYARSPGTIELMLTNMFVGRPPGNYDRLLDVSRAVTGSLFFVPSVPLLESLADDPADGDPADGDAAGTGPDQDGTAEDGTDDHAAGPAAPPGSAGSLGIGSLRGVTQHG